jgi:hypothetical protein
MAVILFLPDYTVGFGLVTESAVKNGSRACGTKPHTAGGELHPALRTTLK